MRRALPFATLTAAALVLAGCNSVDQGAIAAEPLKCPEGSDCFDPAIPVGEGGSISIEAGDLFFQNLTGVAGDGPNLVRLINIGAAEHNFRIDQAAGENKLVEAAGGETVEGELLLYAGTYTYYCDIPGHRAAGMEGTINVLEDAKDAAGLVPENDATDVADVEDAESGSLPGESDDVGSDGDTAIEGTEDTGEPETDPADEILAGGELTADTIAELDDSDDVAGALDARGSARLYQVTFATNSAELQSEADDVVEQIVAYLQANPAASLRVEGNSDSTGSAEANAALSEDRAAAVLQALLDLGIPENRVTSVGNGEDNLLVEDDADDSVAQQINRRVEIFLG